ncbi:MAG: hypothetical protein WBW03_07955, partial [Silvibacterium sp.]
ISAGNGAPPPEEIQLKENIASYKQLLRVDSDFWPVISANALTEPIRNDGSAARALSEPGVPPGEHDETLAIAKSYLIIFDW